MLLLVSQMVRGGVAAAEPGVSQTVNGGALNVEEGARVRFLSSVKMGNIGVDTVDLDNMVHGGCVYNKVYATGQGWQRVLTCAWAMGF